VNPGGTLILKIENPLGVRKLCPEQCNALIECPASVNFWCHESGGTPVIALSLDGPTDSRMG
jgi:hypothetical protein